MYCIDLSHLSDGFLLGYNPSLTSFISTLLTVLSIYFNFKRVNNGNGILRGNLQLLYTLPIRSAITGIRPGYSRLGALRRLRLVTNTFY